MSRMRERRVARTGLWLFAVYAAFYAAFVLTSAFAADWMERRPAAGLNLAILWGFGLIGLAVGLALAYGYAARGHGASEPRTNDEEGAA